MYLISGVTSPVKHTLQKKNKPSLAANRPSGTMVQWALSRTLSLLVVAIVVHLIVMTSVAEKEFDNGGAFSRNKRSYETSSGRSGGPSASSSAAATSANRHRGGSGANALQSGGAPLNVFATENSTVITAQTGGTATLPCVVRKFGSGVVTWIRKKDLHLLTVGQATYSSDDRFLVIHARHAQSHHGLQNWGLQIKYVQPRDAGLYECQVSTHPPTSIFIELKVIEASAEILGAPDLFIKSGSQLRLVCSLRQSTEAPIYVFWYHESKMINYDTTRGVRVGEDRGSSVLTVGEARKTDTGNYTCVPSNARAASINVHVLNGEKPAAMQHGSRTNGSPEESGSRGTSSSGVMITWCVGLVSFWLQR